MENQNRQTTVSPEPPVELLAIGATINRNGIKGKILAVGWVGERYYWLDCDGTISMIPATALISER